MSVSKSHMYIQVCVWGGARARVCACVHACMHACVCVFWMFGWIVSEDAGSTLAKCPLLFKEHRKD